MRILEVDDVVEHGTILQVLYDGMYFPRVFAGPPSVRAKVGDILFVLDIVYRDEGWICVLCLFEHTKVYVNVHHEDLRIIL